MIPKIRNIIIFIVIAIAFVMIYIYFIKPSTPQASLVSSPASSTQLPDVNGSVPNTNTSDQTALVAKDFLTLLLSVKNIKLDDSIFSDPAFSSLQDSSIVLVQDGTEGRPNPFAQFGNDNASLSSNAPSVTPPAPASSGTPPPATPAPANP